MTGWPVPNGHCDVCDHRYFYDEHEESSSCPRCERAKRALGDASEDVMSWVQAVAKKAAADALDDMRTEMRRGYGP